jgi:alcohol dehydrogenase
MNLHVVPDDIPTERAVFAEPLAAACEILEQVAIPCGDTVAVLGDGKLGLLIAMVLDAHGYRVHQFGRHAEKLRLSPAQVSTEPPPSSEYAWTVDATGNAGGFRTAVAMPRPRGTLILKSTVHGKVPVDTAPIIVNEITLVGSRCGRMEAALPLLRLLPVQAMIAARFALSEADVAFKTAHGALKVLLRGEHVTLQQ